MPNSFLRFQRPIYPVWRRDFPPVIRMLARPFFEAFYPVHVDEHMPQDSATMARFLADYQLVEGASLADLAQAIDTVDISLSVADRKAKAPIYDDTKGLLRIPAQWEPTERILMSWGRMYPQVYPMHAQMVEAISAVATVELLVPSELWSRTIAVYLQSRGITNFANLEFLVLRTDDIWIRDYGAIMGVNAHGERVAINPTYAVLPQYPQSDDDDMNHRWAAHHNIPLKELALFTEGGNLWSDGEGTLIMSSQIFYSNRYHNRATLLEYLHGVLDFEKVIITPRLTLEETGHVDLLTKLIAPNRIMISAATSATTREALRKNKRLFERETNANSEPYAVIQLPTPPLYLNWFTYTVRRAYTNSLTVNGRVLVPTYETAADEVALRIYEDALPDYEIIPIDSSVGVHGGGAVHCMTKEVPTA